MAQLSPRDAVDAVRGIYTDRQREQERLRKIRDALAPWGHQRGPSVELPEKAPQVMTNLAKKARTNYLPLILDSYSQVLKVEGFNPSADDQGRMWSYWQKNRFDAQQTGLHRAALEFGTSYVILTPGSNGPVWSPRTPLTVTTLYQNWQDDEWPMLAMEVEGSMVKLYDEEFIYYIGRQNQPQSAYGYRQNWAQPLPDYTFLEARPHGSAQVPIVRYRDRMLLDGEDQLGIIEPLISIQQRIDETVFEMMIAQYFQAFQQRYVIGWVPQNEEEALKSIAAQNWYFKDEDVKVGQLDAGAVTPYIDSKNAARQDMAAISQLSAAALAGGDGVSNTSADALSGLETGKDRKAAEIATSMGESHEQLMRATAHLDGFDQGANDFAAEMRWMRTVDMNLAQATDALSKWVISLGVNDKMARSMLPGWTDQMEAENKRLGPSQLSSQADPASAFLAALDRQNGSAAA